jgi:hypothetical protein
MNRRHFIAGSVALAGQNELLRSMQVFSASEPGARQITTPMNLLSATYSEAFLADRLIPVKEWRPYPRCGERGPWQAIPQDIRAALLERAQAEQKTGWKELLATDFLEFKRDGNRTRYEASTFGRRAQLQHFVLAECVEGQGRLLDDIANGIWLICEESFWGIPAHLGVQRAGVGLPDVTEPIVELFGAETAALLAWTRYLLGEQLDQLSPLIVKRIQIEAERRILEPARNRDDFAWSGFSGKSETHRLNNWNPWINSNLLVSNLLLEDDPKLRLHEVVRITKSLDAFLNQYWPDAGEEEGPVYFSRSPLSYFECVKTLESATGNATTILANPFLDAMGRYILNARIAADDYISYGDAHAKAGPDGAVLYSFGKAVHDEQLEAFGAYLAAQDGWTATGQGFTKALNANLSSLSRSLPAVLAANEIRTARKEDALPRDVWYPSLGLMTAREEANSSAGMYLAVLAANNGRSHSHNDSGSYIVYQDGDPVAIDVGVEAYSAKTFGRDRYSVWTMQSAFHNLPTIGGVMQREGIEYRATQLNYESTGDHAVLSFDLATAYPKEAGIKRWIRTVTLDRLRSKVTVQEEFDLERMLPVSLSIMTPRPVSADKAGIIVLQATARAGKPAMLRYDGVRLRPEVEKIPLHDPWLCESWGNEIYRIMLQARQPVASAKWSYEFSAFQE